MWTLKVGHFQTYKNYISVPRATTKFCLFEVNGEDKGVLDIFRESILYFILGIIQPYLKSFSNFI